MSSSQRGINQPALSVPFQQNQRQNDVTQQTFFAQPNYARLLQPLREQYERKMNVDELPDDVDKRLQKSLQHYMKEIFRVNGSNTPINTLNQEVYRETTLNFDGWLQKQVSTTAAKRPTFNNTIQDPLFENVGNRFEREQQSRAPAPIQPMTSVDFTLSKDEDADEDPLDKYERLRKQRELESKQTSNIGKARASDQYSEPSGPSATTLIPPVQQNNPPPPALLAPRPQEYLIKQEDVVKYKENEINLFIYSGDRDWLANRNENRYNFTINFNPASNSNSATFSPSVKERFKNIVRMELVKAILSSEPLEVSVKVTSGAVDTSRVINLLSYPYVMIRISEWTSNGFGTNANIDNTFGLVQYDQTWKSDGNAPNFGFISMTPRYLKSQRVYAPAPLATIQKLSFQVERPDGNPLTTMLDTLDIGNIYMPANITGSTYSTVPDNNSYIFIKTKTWFSRFFVNEGDRIEIRGYDVGTSANLIAAYQNDFNNYINSTEGHIVVGTAYSNSTSVPNTLTDTYNSVGYSNYIIIRSRFNDPTTGSTTRNFFGGNSTNEGYISTQLGTNALSTNCALLNTNRQSHFVLRIITREMDGSSNLRPDNS
jgi:hypothetical protein